MPGLDAQICKSGQNYAGSVRIGVRIWLNFAGNELILFCLVGNGNTQGMLGRAWLLIKIPLIN